MKIACEELKNAKLDNYVLTVIQALCMCLHYSVELSMEYFEEEKITSMVISTLFNIQFNYPSDLLKRAIYAYISLISAPKSIGLIDRLINTLADLCDKMTLEEKTLEENSDDEEELNDNPYYASPLKKIHVLCYAKLALEDIASKYPEYYNQLELLLTEENKVKMQKAMTRAEQL